MKHDETILKERWDILICLYYHTNQANQKTMALMREEYQEKWRKADRRSRRYIDSRFIETLEYNREGGS